VHLARDRDGADLHSVTVFGDIGGDDVQPCIDVEPVARGTIDRHRFVRVEAQELDGGGAEVDGEDAAHVMLVSQQIAARTKAVSEIAAEACPGWSSERRPPASRATLSAMIIPPSASQAWDDSPTNPATMTRIPPSSIPIHAP